MAIPRLGMSCKYQYIGAMLHLWLVPEDLAGNTVCRLKLTTDDPPTTRLSGKLMIADAEISSSNPYARECAGGQMLSFALLRAVNLLRWNLGSIVCDTSNTSRMGSIMPAINTALVDTLKGELQFSTFFLPGDPGYEQQIERWSDTGVKRAGIVVCPSEVSDISKTLVWAADNGIDDLAVRGGGHSVSGTSSSDGGLVIDLSRLNAVSVDPSGKTVVVQGGALWRDVDEALGRHGLASVGGTVNHTGVGGLTCGGGYGWLSGMYGLVIDNLLAATVVLADGRVVKASATQNEDLYWAIRGAGYNFGIVADFTFQAYDQPDPVFAGILGFTPDKVEAVIEALNEAQAKNDPRAGAMCVFAQPPGAPGPGPNVILFYNGTREQGEGHFDKVLGLGPVANMLDVMPYTAVNAIQNQMSTHGGRKTFKGVFYNTPLDPAFARSMFDQFAAKLHSDPDLAQSGLLVEYWDLNKICSVPSKSTAFGSRNFTQNGLIAMRWSDPAKDAEMRAWSRELQGRWKAELDKDRPVDEGVDVPQYINYAEPGDSAVANIYGDNLARLRRVKAAYDPGNVFRKMHPVEPYKA